VSPYLNLFRNEAGAVPNYQVLVRPLQQQYEVNQLQQRLLLQQTQVVQQLQFNMKSLEQQATGALVAPTGHGSWFARPSSRSTFLNTSRYYSQAGSLPAR
jgi:hypothetical protein